MRTFEASGGDLFRIALQVYGDAQAWNLIAQANGLLDPVITGQVTLVIPPYTPAQTGGVLVL